MEQMLANLKEALEEMKRTKPDIPAQKILQRAIDQAVSIKKKWVIKEPKEI